MFGRWPVRVLVNGTGTSVARRARHTPLALPRWRHERRFRAAEPHARSSPSPRAGRTGVTMGWFYRRSVSLQDCAAAAFLAPRFPAAHRLPDACVPSSCCPATLHIPASPATSRQPQTWRTAHGSAHPHPTTTRSMCRCAVRLLEHFAVLPFNSFTYPVVKIVLPSFHAMLPTCHAPPTFTITDCDTQDNLTDTFPLPLQTVCHPATPCGATPPHTLPLPPSTTLPFHYSCLPRWGDTRGSMPCSGRPLPHPPPAHPSPLLPVWFFWFGHFTLHTPLLFNTPPPHPTLPTRSPTRALHFTVVSDLVLPHASQATAHAFPPCLLPAVDTFCLVFGLPIYTALTSPTSPLRTPTHIMAPNANPCGKLPAGPPS